MSQSTDEHEPSLREAVGTALEAARIEVVDRMTRERLPLSLTVPDLQIVGDDSGGWSSEWAAVQLSGLRDFRVQEQIADKSVPLRLLGLRPQLEPLAVRLDRTTDLGTRIANPSFAPALSGVEAILVRYVTPLAYAYLGDLPDLSRGDNDLIDRLTSELEELIAPDVILTTNQLAIAGLRVSSPLEYRGVKLRPLSPSERGQFYRSRNNDLLNLSPKVGSGTFFVPKDLAAVTPSALLEVTTSRPRTAQFSQSTLMNRVALAFFLLGHSIASPGIVVTFDHPTWATMGQSHQHFLVDEKFIAGDQLLSEDDFRRVVDLAYRMPEFGPAETNSREIALYRTLRGLGMHWQESGFLDFMIALEAALLQGFNDELKYRFALYGSLFLADSTDPQKTFAKLKNMYDVRSKLVHGSSVPPTKRQQALEDAPELAKAIILKAIEHGWPEQKALDALALTRGE